MEREITVLDGQRVAALWHCGACGHAWAIRANHCVATAECSGAPYAVGVATGLTPVNPAPATPDDALSVLRDLVAYWDATHPDAIDPDMDVDLRVRLVNQGSDLRRRARALVAEHATDKETT